MEEYFTPRKNVDFQVFQFCQTAQLPDKTIDQFVTRLRKLAAACEFHDISREIKSTVNLNCLSKRHRWHALREIESDITLDNLIAKAWSLEISEVQASGKERTVASEDVNRVSYKRPIKPVFHQQRIKFQQLLNRC